MNEQFWQRDGTIPIPEWLKVATDAECCDATSPEEDPWFCTRPPGHPGRHVATGGALLFAAWPGTHAVVRADLKDPVEPDGERSAWVLPDGWEEIGTTPRRGANYRVRVLYEALIDADRYGVRIRGFSGGLLTPDEARDLLGRLTEAVGIVDQLREAER
jgi:hypothetical protein